jgi:four helix bundle protein
MTPQELRARTYRFALGVVTMIQRLPRSIEAQEIGRQLLRSSTGTAANYRACGRARSDREFAAKIGVSLEEADESVLWLRLLIDASIGTKDSAQNLLIEARELTAILAASRRTVLKRLSEKRRTDAGLRARVLPRAFVYQIPDD